MPHTLPDILKRFLLLVAPFILLGGLAIRSVSSLEEDWLRNVLIEAAAEPSGE